MTDRRDPPGYAVSLFPPDDRRRGSSASTSPPEPSASRNIDGMAVLVADLEANRQVLKDTLGG